MHLKKVYIYSDMTALLAENRVNEMISEFSDENTTVNFELQIENSVASGPYAETRYTLIIYIFSLIYGEECTNGD